MIFRNNVFNVFKQLSPLLQDLVEVDLIFAKVRLIHSPLLSFNLKKTKYVSTAQ